jgi:hypothetical protein
MNSPIAHYHLFVELHMNPYDYEGMGLQTNMELPRGIACSTPIPIGAEHISPRWVELNAKRS